MRKLVYLVASTIDGFIADPGRADPSDTVFLLAGDHAGPLLQEYPGMVPAHLRSQLGMRQDAESRHFDTVLEGRTSYVMALQRGVTNAYPHLRHYVFSRTLTELPDPRIELVSGDPVAKVRELKQEDGKDIWLCRGGSPAASPSGRDRRDPPETEPGGDRVRHPAARRPVPDRPVRAPARLAA